jgi:hypothetical protein
VTHAQKLPTYHSHHVDRARRFPHQFYHTPVRPTEHLKLVMLEAGDSACARRACAVGVRCLAPIFLVSSWRRRIPTTTTRDQGGRRGNCDRSAYVYIDRSTGSTLAPSHPWSRDTLGCESGRGRRCRLTTKKSQDRAKDTSFTTHLSDKHPLAWPE